MNDAVMGSAMATGTGNVEWHVTPRAIRRKMRWHSRPSRRLARRDVVEEPGDRSDAFLDLVGGAEAVASCRGHFGSFAAVACLVRDAEELHDRDDRLRCVGVPVHVLGPQVAEGDAECDSSLLRRRPFQVEDDDHRDDVLSHRDPVLAEAGVARTQDLQLRDASRAEVKTEA